MATESTTQAASAELNSSNVRPISPVTNTMEYSRNIAAKSLSTVANSSKFLWHTWLGTAVTSQETATSFAQSMAKKGEETEEQAKRKLKEKINEAKTTTRNMRDRARTRMDVLEDRVGRTMGRSLHFMGVPTRGDVDRLALLMADMSESIEELTALKEQQQPQGKAKRPPASS